MITEEEQFTVACAEEYSNSQFIAFKLTKCCQYAESRLVIAHQRCRYWYQIIIGTDLKKCRIFKCWIFEQAIPSDTAEYNNWHLPINCIFCYAYSTPKSKILNFTLYAFKFQNFNCLFNGKLYYFIKAFLTVETMEMPSGINSTVKILSNHCFKSEGI